MQTNQSGAIVATARVGMICILSYHMVVYERVRSKAKIIYSIT